MSSRASRLRRTPSFSSSSSSSSSSNAAAGGGEERLLERVGAVAGLQLVGGLEREQPAAVEDADPVGERLRLGQVVRAEQDRRVVPGADLADEVLHLALRARVEPGRRLVEQEQHRAGEQRPRERDLLLHPAREVLHRLVAPLVREADPLEDRGDLVARVGGRHAVEAGRVAEVLRRATSS